MLCIVVKGSWYIFINNEDMYFKSHRDTIYKIASFLSSVSMRQIAESPGQYGKFTKQLKKLMRIHKRANANFDTDKDHCRLTCTSNPYRCCVCNTYLLEKSWKIIC